MSNEIVISESVQLGVVQASSPKDVIARASDMAVVLADIIEKKKLYSPINGKKYVRVDGWSTLGAMLGVLPHEVRSIKIDNGYEAYVELIRMTDGAVIGGSSAICTRDERNWSNRDEFAIKSMATTRATGKAYRLAFSWIMNLAGYESTPAEEMIDVEVIEQKKIPSEPVKKPGRPYTAEIVRENIRKLAEKHANKIASDAQKNLLVGMLDMCFAGSSKEVSDMKRHQVCSYLTGEASSKKIPSEYVIAMLDWLKPTQDSGGAYTPDPMAIKEIGAILEAQVVESGQEKLI